MNREEPWEHESFNSRNHGRSHYGGRNTHFVYDTRYETVKDSTKLLTRKGDIIKFGSGYYERHFNDWRDWFPTTKADKRKFWPRRSNIAKYAMNQYALVANRYRWMKFKHQTYIDYGVIAMFVTGKKPCQIRKYYTDRPYHIISAFPHINRNGNIFVKMKKPFRVVDKQWFLFDFNLSEFIIELMKHGDSEESRDVFLKKTKELLETNI